jgi:hypothetical protein
MSNKKIHIIHPKDDSTDFLEGIYKDVCPLPEIETTILRIISQDEYFAFFKMIPTLPNNELVLFLGHGTSTALSGPRTRDFEIETLIGQSELKIFDHKNVVLLSCRSNQFLKSFFKERNLRSAIGFPNLITDFAEVEHHDNPERLQNITQEDIELFKTNLVEIIKYSLEDYVNNELNIFQFYNRIKLRINKRVIKLYKENPKNGKLPLGKMLNDMADGLSFFCRY